MLNTAHQCTLRATLAVVAACVLWLLVPAAANAQSVSCNATTSPSTLNAGAVIPWSSSTYSATGSIAVSCSNSSLFGTYVSVCLSVGTGGAGAGFTSRQITTSGGTSGAALGISITSNNAYFGSYFDSSQSSIRLPTQYINGRGNLSFASVPITAAINGGQITAPVGSYSSAYSGGHTAVSVATGNSNVSCKTTAPSGDTFPFTVTATIPSYCEFSSSIADMAFADTPGLKNASQASSTNLSLRCTTSTAYSVTLQPSNNDTGGNGQMKAVGAPGNTDTVPYSLSKSSGGSPAWGTLATNLYSGTGTGNSQVLPVHGTVPADLNVIPGNYKDSVLVTVTY